ncbi:HDOD domain-containing protein [Undibacterium arcticum]|uniref:HDOD domain-containing protein n=2 Tax=Undibacterium arcticum TaxID=1762892 RepID=A0ABV7FAR4_9BURK
MPEASHLNYQHRSRSGACDRFLQKIGINTDLPALGSAVARVVQLTSSDGEAVHNLTHLVLSDVALTQKILRLSNTAVYRTVSGGKPVTTISRAIFLLGFDTIKTAALAMLLVDGLTDGKHAHSVRSELARALYASVIGRELARRSHHPGAEEAAIAALFKNLGRLLVASHDHALYSEIVALIDSGSHTAGQAAMQVMGCSFELLADTVLQQWDIPDTIIRALVPTGSRVLRPSHNRQEWMQQVATFSAEAARLVPAMQEGGDNGALCQPLLARFGAALNLDQDKLEQLFANVAQEIRILADSMDLALPPPPLLPPMPPMPMPIAAAAPAEPDGLPSELLMVQLDAGAQQSDARHASGKPLHARELLLAGVQDVTQMMASGRCKTNELILQVLETIYRSMGFRFAALCLRDPKSGQFRARIAIGEQHAARQSGFAFSRSSTRDLFQLALDNDADLMVSDATTAKIRDLIPAWHRALLPDARSFIVLPLVLQKMPLGLFYADRAQLAPEGVPSDEAALIKTLKGQVLAALNPG